MQAAGLIGAEFSGRADGGVEPHCSKRPQGRGEGVEGGGKRLRSNQTGTGHIEFE